MGNLLQRTGLCVQQREAICPLEAFCPREGGNSRSSSLCTGAESDDATFLENDGQVRKEFECMQWRTIFPPRYVSGTPVIATMLSGLVPRDLVLRCHPRSCLICYRFTFFNAYCLVGSGRVSCYLFLNSVHPGRGFNPRRRVLLLLKLLRVRPRRASHLRSMCRGSISWELGFVPVARDLVLLHAIAPRSQLLLGDIE